MSDWAELRRDFPAVSRYTYLNAAAASPIPRPVREASETFYRQLELDGDVHWSEWLEQRERARASVARLVNAEPDEIAFVPNTSTGMNLIVDLLERDGAVVSDTLEFPAVTLPWIHRGLAVRFVEPDASGVLDPQSFEMPADAAAVAPVPGQPGQDGTGSGSRGGVLLISHVQFSNGCRQDLDEFAAVKGGRRLVVCGSQSTGAFPVDIKRHRIDAFATAGHKWLCAGYGAGFCVIARELLARPPRAIGWLSVKAPYAFDNRHVDLLDGNRRHEMGCPPFGPIFALGAAVEYLLGIGIDRIAARVLALNAHLTDELARIGVRVLSPDGPHRSGETLCAFPDPASVVEFLGARGIVVTKKPEGIRVATHFYNDEQDIDRLVAALREGGLRS
jgi:selenocysteine lyase/cysteine desulfurase